MSSRSTGPFQIFASPIAASLIAVLATFFVAQVIAAQNSPAQDHATRGISLVKEGKLPEAEQELQAAVRVAPAVALYRAQLGSILGLEGKWKEALASFQKAVELAPEDINFRRETAAVQWQLGLMSPAEKNLQYVLAKNPSDSGSILLLGLVKEKTGDYAGAAQLLDSQFELVITHPDRTVALFHSLVQSDQHEKTTKIVEVLKQHTNDRQWSNAINQCAQIAAQAGDSQTGEFVFALIPNDDPARVPAGIQMARLLYSRRQVSQAKELLMQLSTRGANSAELQVLLGNCLEAERQPDLALQAYQRAVQINPSQVEYYEDPISLLLYLRKTSEAMSLIDHVLAVAPNDARPWVWKGNVELRRNAYKEATESYKRAVALDGSNADAIFGVAAAYFVTGQNGAAIAQYKVGIARFPNDARFYVGYAEMIVASPDSLKLQRQTEGLLHKALKLAPRSAQAHYLLGQLAMQQGRLKDAEAEFLRSLESDPDRSKTHFALSVIYRRTGRADDATKEFALYQNLKQMEDGGNSPPMTAVEKP